MKHIFADNWAKLQEKSTGFVSSIGTTAISPKIVSALFVPAMAGVTLASSYSPGHAIGFEMLAPHRAVYDVKLENGSDRSGIDGLTGRMVYEVTGNECDGITIRYRFKTKISAGQEQMATDQVMVTYESADGKEFSFKNKSMVNDQLDQDIVGVAEKSNKGITVKFTKPEGRELKLGDAYFMSSQLVEVISKAEAGENFVRRDIYDGSGDGDEVIASSTVIGSGKTVDTPFKDENGDAMKKLEHEKAWPVSTSYFKKATDHSGEATPIYEASFLLYPNGVSRNVEMRYPDYTLKAQLQKLDYLERKKCK